MSISAARIGAVVRKELTEFRRSPFIVGTMAILPVIFLVVPTVTILSQGASEGRAALQKVVGFALLYLLLIPAVLPSTVAAYSVVGERDQGTLEPLLTTPIRREELLIGKAAAALIPAVGVAYLILGAFLAIVQFGADPVVASTVWHAPELLGEVFFIPLLGGWAIWVGLAISSKVSEVRIAQQLGILASFPPIALIALMSFAVITPTLGLALIFGGVLLVIDIGAYLLVSQLFDRERLITGTKPSRVHPA
ncbi:MAG TPA: ABC transporter permease subunit [Streptosporangiaceae bacterium]|jgi:ABC-2 type transport system permease protein